MQFSTLCVSTAAVVMTLAAQPACAQIKLRGGKNGSGKMIFLAASALLLVEPSNAQKLPPRQRRLRVLSTESRDEDLSALDSSSMSFIGIDDSDQGSGSSVSSTKFPGKACKSSKWMKARSLTGDYSAIDTEDGTPQRLRIFCDKGICDITLRDARFSTCAKIGAGTNGGVGIAKNIPEGSICNFTIDLYCLQPGETVINFDNNPTTTLQGDIEILPGGGLRRIGPGFFYAKGSVPEIKDVTGEVVNINDKSVNINGKYRAIDFEDGSNQFLDILCTKKSCDIELVDPSFGTCKDQRSFFQGFGIAKNVTRNSLDNFDIKLYCLEEGEREIDPESRAHDAILEGDMSLVRDGIITRTVPGFRYAKVGPAETNEAFSVYKDFAQGLFGKDAEDGSNQSLQLFCKEGLCDIKLGDSSFSTCIDNIDGERYLGGLATARGVPQDSLHDFDLDLFCSSGGPGGINYTTPVAQLKGNMVFLQAGIVQRTVTGSKYFNLKSDEAVTLTTGSSNYRGFRTDTGGQVDLRILCEHGMCQVIIWTPIYGKCIGPSGGKRFLNGVAFNSTVPEESLESFEIGLFCVPPGAGSEIDYENPQPVTTIKAGITMGYPSGVIHLIGGDVVYDLIKFSSV